MSAGPARGVLRERAPAGRRSQYDVLGLAMPVRWSDGRFFFESLNPKAVPVIDPVSDVLEATANAEVDQEAAADAGTLDDDYDARRRVYRQIVSRRGQSGFPGGTAGGPPGRCAVTGCDATAALEGTHLCPYRGPESNTVSNGLLLTADIHAIRSPVSGPGPCDPDHRGLEAPARHFVPRRGSTADVRFGSEMGASARVLVRSDAVSMTACGFLTSPDARN